MRRAALQIELLAASPSRNPFSKQELESLRQHAAAKVIEGLISLLVQGVLLCVNPDIDQGAIANSLVLSCLGLVKNLVKYDLEGPKTWAAATDVLSGGGEAFQRILEQHGCSG